MRRAESPPSASTQVDTEGCRTTSRPGAIAVLMVASRPRSPTPRSVLDLSDVDGTDDLGSDPSVSTETKLHWNLVGAVDSHGEFEMQGVPGRPDVYGRRAGRMRREDLKAGDFKSSVKWGQICEVGSSSA